MRTRVVEQGQMVGEPRAVRGTDSQVMRWCVAASDTAGLLRRRWIVGRWRWRLLVAEPVPQLPERDERHDGDDQNAAGYPPGDAHVTEVTALRAAGDSVSGLLEQADAGSDQLGTARLCDYLRSRAQQAGPHGPTAPGGCP